MKKPTKYEIGKKAWLTSL